MITTKKGFYMHSWSVKKNNVCIGRFDVSEQINPYELNLVFEINHSKLTSSDLRYIADELDILNNMRIKNEDDSLCA